MCGVHSWRFARQTRECGSFPSTPHWLKTAQMGGLSLNSRMDGKCYLGGHWRRGSSLREYPFSLCHKEYNVSISKQILFNSSLPKFTFFHSCSTLPWGKEKSKCHCRERVGGRVTCGCPDHIGEVSITSHAGAPWKAGRWRDTRVVVGAGGGCSHKHVSRKPKVLLGGHPETPGMAVFS